MVQKLHISALAHYENIFLNQFQAFQDQKRSVTAADRFGIVEPENHLTRRTPVSGEV